MGGNHAMREDDINYQRFLDGDIEGFETLVLTYKNNLIHFIYRYVQDYTLAEDIAQDAFVEVYVHKERFRLGDNFKTYLFTIGRNKAVDYIRKFGREMLQGEVEQSQEEWFSNQSDHLIGRIPEKSPEEQMLQKEERQALYQAMDQLKDEYKEVLLLIDFEELSYQEAAKIMRKTLPQVKILVHRARKGLAKVMLKEGYQYEK